MKKHQMSITGRLAAWWAPPPILRNQMLAEFRQEEWRSRDESCYLRYLQTLGCIGSNKISYGGLRHNDITDAPRSGKRSRSRVRLSRDKQGQGLGARNGRIPARELRRGLMGEARLVTYDADGKTPALVICCADVIGQRYITYRTGDWCP